MISFDRGFGLSRGLKIFLSRVCIFTDHCIGAQRWRSGRIQKHGIVENRYEHFSISDIDELLISLTPTNTWTASYVSEVWREAT